MGGMKNNKLRGTRQRRLIYLRQPSVSDSSSAVQVIIATKSCPVRSGYLRTPCDNGSN